LIYLKVNNQLSTGGMKFVHEIMYLKTFTRHCIFCWVGTNCPFNNVCCIYNIIFIIPKNMYLYDNKGLELGIDKFKNLVKELLFIRLYIKYSAQYSSRTDVE